MIQLKHHSQAKLGTTWFWHPFFQPWEFADRISGELVLDPDFMDWLYQIRLAFDRPMVINSGYRSPDHPEESGKASPGAHTAGQAADVRISNPDASDLLEIAVKRGVLGLGVHLTGDVRAQYLHLDRWSKRPGFTAWSYPGEVGASRGGAMS